MTMYSGAAAAAKEEEVFNELKHRGLDDRGARFFAKDYIRHFNELPSDEEDVFYQDLLEVEGLA